MLIGWQQRRRKEATGIQSAHCEVDVIRTLFDL
jgi:hypothetical protein